MKTIEGGNGQGAKLVVIESLHLPFGVDPFIGPISSVTVLGQPIVIINDLKIAVELLNRRSAIHSSRPNMIFASEM